MRFSVGFGSRIIGALALIAACGDGGNEADAECVNNVCPCTEAGIRAAIAEGDGRYTFRCEGPTRIITRAEMIIDSDVTLDGEGNLTVDGDQRHRVFSVEEEVTVELIGFTVVNGRQIEEHGGCIRNAGTLTLSESTVSGCSAGRESGCRTDDRDLLCSEGGGIWNTGTLTLAGSTVAASSAHFGGGIGNRQGSVSLIDSSVLTSVAQGCRGTGAVVCSGGGGIWSSSTLMLMNSTVSENDADWGGGIYSRAVATLDNSVISGNSAGFDGGGLLNFDALTLIDTTVANNSSSQNGGGLANQAPSTLDVSSSTLSGNGAAAGGGGIYNPGGASAELLNTTISGNTANQGGGIYNGGTLAVTSSTVADNAASSASAIYDPGSSNATSRLMTSTLVVGGCAGPSRDSGGYNVESPGDTCGFDQASDLPAQPDVDLGPLRDNGGPTLTHAPLDGSIAIDQIPEPDCVDRVGDPLRTDQRGEPRPGGTSSACDVGALETQP